MRSTKVKEADFLFRHKYGMSQEYEYIILSNRPSCTISYTTPTEGTGKASAHCVEHNGKKPFSFLKQARFLKEV